MKIPVFVSSPTWLSPAQEAARTRVIRHLDRLKLEPRALGRSDYPTEFPLREVQVIAKHCSGGVILGFEQLRVTAGVDRPGTKKETPLAPGHTLSVPSAWNHLEAGIMFGLGLPLLIFKEPTIFGGVFDNGVTDVFVHNMPASNVTKGVDAGLTDVFLKWRSRVSEHYYA
jgi:hypothetical protein